MGREECVVGEEGRESSSDGKMGSEDILRERVCPRKRVEGTVAVRDL